jgi:hypothetical protein
MQTVTRIAPSDAHHRLQSGNALLVCAYEDPNKCRDASIAGAISLQELQKREKSLGRTQELIFYCA